MDSGIEGVEVVWSLKTEIEGEGALEVKERSSAREVDSSAGGIERVKGVEWSLEVAGIKVEGG